MQQADESGWPQGTQYNAGPNPMQNDMDHGHTGKHSVISQPIHAPVSASACTMQ
jgi:hypothetical protein